MDKSIGGSIESTFVIKILICRKEFFHSFLSLHGGRPARALILPAAGVLPTHYLSCNETVMT